MTIQAQLEFDATTRSKKLGEKKRKTEKFTNKQHHSGRLYNEQIVGDR